MVLTRVILLGINTRVWLSPQFILQIKIGWVLYHFWTACARELSLTSLFCGLPVPESWTCPITYHCAPGTLGCLCLGLGLTHCSDPLQQGRVDYTEFPPWVFFLFSLVSSPISA